MDHSVFSWRDLTVNRHRSRALGCGGGGPSCAERRRLPDGWKSSDSDGPNPEECRRRLEAEGVAFGNEARVSRRQCVAWDIQVERADAGERAA